MIDYDEEITATRGCEQVVKQILGEVNGSSVKCVSLRLIAAVVEDPELDVSDVIRATVIIGGLLQRSSEPGFGVGKNLASLGIPTE